jgi:hypothetical protein
MIWQQECSIHVLDLFDEQSRSGVTEVVADKPSA